MGVVNSLSSYLINLSANISVQGKKVLFDTEEELAAILYFPVKVLLPRKPFGMFLPGVITWLPVPQSSITEEALHIVPVAWDTRKEQSE